MRKVNPGIVNAILLSISSMLIQITLSNRSTEDESYFDVEFSVLDSR